MFSHYRKTPSSSNNKPSVHAQLTAYLDLIAEQDSVPCFGFWQQHKAKFPALYQLATQVAQVFLPPVHPLKGYLAMEAF